MRRSISHKIPWSIHRKFLVFFNHGISWVIKPGRLFCMIAANATAKGFMLIIYFYFTSHRTARFGPPCIELTISSCYIPVIRFANYIH